MRSPRQFMTPLCGAGVSEASDPREEVKQVFAVTRTNRIHCYKNSEYAFAVFGALWFMVLCSSFLCTA